MLVDVENTQHLERLIDEHELVLVDFRDEACVSHVEFATAATEHPAIVFARLKHGQDVDLAKPFSMPNLWIFRQGIAVYSESDDIGQVTLNELIAQALEMDVSTIHDC